MGLVGCRVDARWRRPWSWGIVCLALAACAEGDPPALELAYPASGGPWLVGVEATPLEPETDVPAGTLVTVEPALPGGLHLDPATGRIDGVPAFPLEPTAFTLSAHAGGASAQAEVTLEVLAELPHSGALWLAHPDSSSLAGSALTDSGVADTPRAHPLGEVATTASPADLAADALGRFLLGLGPQGLQSHLLGGPDGRAVPGDALPLEGATRLALAPCSGHAHVAFRDAGLVATLDVDVATGALAPVGQPFHLPGVDALAHAGDGTHLLAASERRGYLACLATDPHTGFVFGPLAAASLERPTHLATSTSTPFVVVAQADPPRLAVFALGTQGELTPVHARGLDAACTALEMRGDTVAVGLASGELAVLHLDALGTLTPRGTLDLPTAPRAVAFGVPEGELWIATTARVHRALLEPHPIVDRSWAAAPGASALVCVGSAAQREARLASLHVGLRGVDALATFLPSPESDTLLATPSQPAWNAPAGIASDPLGGRTFVTAELSGHLHVFSADEIASGAQAAVPPLSVGLLPRSVRATANGRFLLVPSNLGLASLRCADDSGAPLEIPAPVDLARTGWSPADVVVGRGGRHAYTADRGADRVSAFALDPLSGALEVLGHTPCPPDAAPRALALSADGLRLAAALNWPPRVRLWRVDPESGGLTLYRDLPTGGDPRGLAFDPTGRFLAASEHSSDRVAIWELDSGAPPRITATGDGPHAVAFDPNGGRLFVACHGADSIHVFDLDPELGLLREDTTLPFAPGSGPITLHAAVRLAPLDARTR